MPKFSVITAAYNREDLLPRCIDSVLGQSFGDIEHVIVDDGSTDNTPAIVKAYADKDLRTVYLYQENQGANVARNHGCSKATGDYILILDSDDEGRPGWLEDLAKLIDESGLDVACCGVQIFDEQGVLVDTRRCKEDRQGASDGGLFLSGTFAIRREIYLELGGYAAALPAHHSTDFRIRLFDLCEKKGYRIGGINEVLVNGYYHESPSIRRNAEAKLDATKIILELHRDKFKSNQSIASWLASAGGCAAELNKYGEARSFFLQAIRLWPTNYRNYLRAAVCCIPFARNRFWKSTGNLR